MLRHTHKTLIVAHGSRIMQLGSERPPCRKAQQHTHTFNGPLSGTTHVSRYQKVKPIWILLKQETVSGSGINWAICKSAPRSRQITMPAPHHSVFTGRMPFLPPNQQHQNTEGKNTTAKNQLQTKLHKFVIKTDEQSNW